MSSLQLARTALLTIAWLIVLPCVGLMLCVLVPIIPWVRIYAFGFVPNHAPWLLLGSIFVLILGLLVNVRRATRLTLALVVTATLSTLSAAGILIHLLYVAQTNDAQINVVRALSLRDYSDDAAPDESRVYARPQGEILSLDIYRARKSNAAALSPVLIAIHGGGFVEGSRKTGAANMRGYADLGWTVISIDYRLARDGRPTWDLAIEDVRCALAWTVANAQALGVDISRLTMSGASAGGSLALIAAYTPDAPVRAGCGPRLPRIAAVVAKSPLIDLVVAWQRPRELRDLQRSYLVRYIGGPPEQFPARYAAVDPRRLIRTTNPPTLILGGADDPLIDADPARDFARDANAAGANVRLVLFPYSGHDFNSAYYGIVNQAVVQIMGQFLVTHGVIANRAQIPLPK